jgi:hypothetical protein
MVQADLEHPIYIYTGGEGCRPQVTMGGDSLQITNSLVNKSGRLITDRTGGRPRQGAYLWHTCVRKPDLHSAPSYN